MNVSKKTAADAVTCEAKFSSVRAAVRVDLTAARYGLKTLDWINIQSRKLPELS